MYSVIPPIESFKKVLAGLRKQLLLLYESSDKQISQKRDNAPVTAADLLSNRVLNDFLQITKIPVLSEEQQFKNDLGKYFWVVDPLDGTSDFIKHTGEFSVMIGLVKEGNPIFGMIYLPVQDKLYYASYGKGAYVQIGNTNAKKLQIRKVTVSDGLTAVVSRNHFLETDREMLKKLGIYKTIHCGSIGVKIGLLCERNADIFFNTSDKTSIWDTCAPQIIIEESDGIMTDLHGEKLVYDNKSLRNEYGIIATNKLIYGDIVEKIRQ